ncbi:rhodanese-like domain-containing protein [Catenuloplanes atrovinosus]|uniref:Rhodanese-related sulfurtransferase n=1 Tax=Catenuloplanes atrovinosus TaxID=137266 RepID=A0AAE4CCG1_9ACTN|nr:rhodanese-like domain-containing protein [Catenuloplanes atrovinosus]MDR7279148.1 rhodanese-related sulfurtransferase [Catenuloplanes atrovinosus]
MWNEGVAWFSARLDMQIDVSDTHAALESGAPGFVLVDTRSEEAWTQAHVPGALHLPRREIAARAPALIDPATPVVAYCWGPGCDGATRAALAFAQLGYRVKEMIGGIEYWIREGFTVRTPAGPLTRDPDPLTAPAKGAACAC